MSDIIIYEDGNVELKVNVEDESIWLSQKQIAELFEVQRPAVTKHLSNIFKSGELDEKVVCSILEHTTKHGAIEDKNGILHKPNGEPKINDNALASVALLVAQSDPSQKDIIIKLVMNMLYEREV